MSNPNSLPPSVVQTYKLVNPSVVGLTTSFAGSPIAPQEMFDVVGAIALANTAAQVITVSEFLLADETVLVGQLEGLGMFNVCDNAIKQVLDTHPGVLRIA